MKAPTRTVRGQPSWVVRSRDVELAVTHAGGHMAPVTFFRRSAHPVQPYYVSPWQQERRKIAEPVLVPLRGDFFCMPFGEGGPWGATTHPVHGEPAGRQWTFRSLTCGGGLTTLTLTMRTRRLAGRITKTLHLLDRQNVVYMQHVLAGFSCATPLGHHAILDVPAEAGALRLATSPIRFGMTNPVPTGDPAAGEYPSLAPDRRFRRLARVATIWKSPATADLTRLPAREGFTDILAVFSAPGRRTAWTAATLARRGYLWFALKDPARLPATVVWVSNKGRHGPPWDGRNRCLGLEEVCGYFAMGLGASLRANALSRQGIPTAVKLSRKSPTAVNCIQGVVRVPRGFGRVRSAAFSAGKVTFTAEGGRRVTARVHHEFVRTGRLAQ
jgi:hypothetical protein